MPQVLSKDLTGPYQVPNVTTQTTNPGSTNDVAHGYQIGDIWVNTNTGLRFECVSNATGAAVWIGGGSAAITSGTINGAVIGGVTPAAITGTNIVATGFVEGSYSGSLTAVGTNRGTALALTAQTNHVTTAASSAVGVVLPSAATVGVGGIVRVINDGPSNSFHVYAAGSDTIDGTAGATGVVLTNAFYCDYQVDAAGAFISYRGAVTRSA